MRLWGSRPEDVDYDVDVVNGLEETTVSFVKSDAGATVVVNKGGVEDADRVVPFNVDENVITVVVTAADGNTTKIYTVTVTRAASGSQPPGTTTPGNSNPGSFNPGAVFINPLEGASPRWTVAVLVM